METYGLWWGPYIDRHMGYDGVHIYIQTDTWVIVGSTYIQTDTWVMMGSIYIQTDTWVLMGSIYTDRHMGYDGVHIYRQTHGL